jgi:hypothetical protein
MTATRKIAEAEAILAKMQGQPDVEFLVVLNDFVKTVNEIFSHLLEEYQLKFDCKIDRAGLEKFKVKARKSGNVKAISFLIWYEREYRKIKNEPMFVHMLERDGAYNRDISSRDDVISACSSLLNEVKTMTYYAYENF